MYLTDKEIKSLERAVVDMPPQVRDYVQRLVGEVRELRDREAAVAYMHELEG